MIKPEPYQPFSPTQPSKKVNPSLFPKVPKFLKLAATENCSYRLLRVFTSSSLFDCLMEKLELNILLINFEISFESWWILLNWFQFKGKFHHFQASQDLSRPIDCARGGFLRTRRIFFAQSDFFWAKFWTSFVPYQDEINLNRTGNLGIIPELFRPFNAHR